MGVKKYILNVEPIDAKHMLKKAVQLGDWDEVINYEGAFFGIDGKLKLLIKKVEAEDLRKQLLAIPKRPTSQRLSGLITKSIVFGYLPKIAIKQQYCSKTGKALKYKKTEDLLNKYRKDFYDIYTSSFDVPTRLEEEIKKNQLLDYFIPGTLYTSGIINKNNNLAYHTDQGNYPGLFCALLLFKNNVTGGRLSVPAYRVAVEAPDSSIVLFDNQEIIHGVEKIGLINKSSYRFSVVWYNMFNMKFCDHLEQEIKKFAEYQTKQLLKKTKTLKQAFSDKEEDAN